MIQVVQKKVSAERGKGISDEKIANFCYEFPHAADQKFATLVEEDAELKLVPRGRALRLGQ